jgi:hypothetical protein
MIRGFHAMRRRDRRCQRPGRLLHPIGWIAIAMLSACGGEPDDAPKPSMERAAARPAPPPTAKVQEDVAAPAKTPSASKSEIPPAAASMPTAAASPAGPEYLLVILRRKGMHRDSDELVPVHGAGYEPLRAFVYLRGKPKKQSPVADVQPYCASTTQCEYRAPRKAGFADRIMISLDDDSVARLSAADDTVVISARTLAVATPSIVKLTMTIPGQPPVTRQIIYTRSSAPS